MNVSNIIRLMAVKYPQATLHDFHLKDCNGSMTMAYWNTAKLGPQPNWDTLITTAEEEAAYAAKEKAKADDSLSGLVERVKALEDLHK